MKNLLLIIAICLSSSCFSKGEDRMYIDPVKFIKTESHLSLNTNESLFHFDFTGLEQETLPLSITYSVDGVQSVQIMNSVLSLDIQTTPGLHTFSFTSCAGFSPIDTVTLNILPQFRSEYVVYFERQYLIDSPNNATRKPVIYLYPEEEMDVTVQLDFEGSDPFLYPTYNDGWKCTAQPNGDLTIGTETFNYLFWEATQPDHLSTANLNEGFIVEGTNAISFLKEKLTTAGLTSKEQADFITFWGPLIQKNNLNFVRFEFNETCDKFTKLNITPKPDNIYRIYIFFSPIDTAFNIEEQEIKSIVRTGFTVLEWGGQVSNQIQVTPSTL